MLLRVVSLLLTAVNFILGVQAASEMSGEGKLQVEKWNESEDGQLSQETIEKKLTKQGYTFTQYTFWPGCDFPDHTHDHTKKDAVLTGQFEFVMYGEKVILQPGDMVLIPKNTVHNARVVGNKPVIFYDSSK